MKHLSILVCLSLSTAFWIPGSAKAEISDEVTGVDLNSGVSKTFAFKKAQMGTVVVFLSAVCPCSDSHVPALNQLAQEFGSLGFTFVGIHSNANEEFEHSQNYFKKAKLGFPILQDSGAKVADEFEAFKTPHVFVVGPDKKVLFQGGVDDSRVTAKASRHFLRDALVAIRGGREPQERNVRVLGCEIRRP